MFMTCKRKQLTENGCSKSLSKYSSEASLSNPDLHAVLSGKRTVVYQREYSAIRSLRLKCLDKYYFLSYKRRAAQEFCRKYYDPIPPKFYPPSLCFHTHNPFLTESNVIHELFPAYDNEHNKALKIVAQSPY